MLNNNKFILFENNIIYKVYYYLEFKESYILSKQNKRLNNLFRKIKEEKQIINTKKKYKKINKSYKKNK